ncbi:MAG: hypothetical protein HQM07_03520 [Zetaproteobacteria bacterium]|nr:hypothetical protein [Zetaproteobacteria bacterium]
MSINSAIVKPSALDIRRTGANAASWDGHTLMLTGEDPLPTLFMKEGERVLPDQVWVDQPTLLYWPLEHCLVRAFSLPLKQVNLIDAEILQQELVESAAIEAGDWWLSWRAGRLSGDAGVAGVVFGFPEEMRAQVTERMPQAALYVDGWERCVVWQPEGQQSAAIVDADAEGLFLAYFSEGVCAGIRRLNWSGAEGEKARTQSSMVVEMMGSLAAMGYHCSQDPLLGRLDEAWVQALTAQGAMWQGEVAAALPTRHQANLALQLDSERSLNLRHGLWRMAKPWNHLRLWRRPLLLVAGFALVWIGSVALHLADLEGRAQQLQQQLVDAFHQGLPHQSVMLDPLAQLQQAAGSGASDRKVLRQLADLSEIFDQQPWKMQEFSVVEDQMKISGSVEDLKQLEQIRQKLEQKVAVPVRIVDTNLLDKQVNFRLQW